MSKEKWTIETVTNEAKKYKIKNVKIMTQLPVHVQNVF